MVFPGVTKRSFQREAKTGQISFEPLGTEKKKLFLRQILKKHVKFQNPGDQMPPCPPSDAHDPT